jgi:hypothetical protein
MDSEPYMLRPPWARLLQAGFYVVAYLLTGVTGVIAVTAVAEWPARQAGYVLAAGSLVALVGVVSRLYNLELIALWPVTTGYAAIIVWMLLNDAIIGGWIVGAMLPWLALRILTLGQVARRARTIHDVEVANDGMV